MASVHRLPVSLMSPEQAERKRAQDRVNQRYSRARRKSKVEELEVANKALLHKLVSAEAEIARLRDRELAVRKALGEASLSTKEANGNSDQDPSRDRTELSELAFPTPTTSPKSIVLSPTTTETEALEVPHLTRNQIFGTTTTCPIEQFSSEYFLNTLDFASDPTFGLLGSASTKDGDSTDQTQASQWNPIYEIVPRLNTFECNSQLASHTAAIPDWQALPLHLPVTTVLDDVVLKTTESGRQRCRRHAEQQHSELSQQSFPSISSLLNPHSDDDVERPIATAISAQVRRTTVTSFTGRVALHYYISIMLRWYVAPSEETYQQLPEYMRPTHLQRTVAHAPWIDLFCWPEGRDAIIKYMDQSRFDEFRLLTSSTLSVHWPYSDADVFLSSMDGKQVILNPVFVSHIRDRRVSLSQDPC